MSGDRQIKEAIETMSGTRGQQLVKLVECEVISVDESKRTCNVSVIGGNAEYDIENVRLMATVDDGILIIPTVGSQIIVAHNNKNVRYICQFSEIDKVLLITGDTTIEIKDGSVKFNDGSFDGFVKIKDLTDKLNDMVRLLNIELGKIQTGIIAGGGSYTPTNLQNFNKSDYENTKLTHDYLCGSDGDLLIANGDFVVGISDEMHIQDTIISDLGWWKENPQDGVGIDKYMKSTGQEQVLAREIKIQLENDGYTVNNPIVDFSNEKLIITPNAEL